MWRPCSARPCPIPRGRRKWRTPARLRFTKDTRTWRSRDCTSWHISDSGPALTQSLGSGLSCCRASGKPSSSRESGPGGAGMLRLSQPVSRASRNLHRHCPESSKGVLLDSGGPLPFHTTAWRPAPATPRNSPSITAFPHLSGSGLPAHLQFRTPQRTLENRAGPGQIGRNSAWICVSLP